MDVVNVFGPTPTLEMTGIGKTTLEDDLARALAWQAHRLQPDPNVVVGFYYRSDHFRSSRAGCRSRSPASAGNWRRRHPTREIRSSALASTSPQPSERRRWTLKRRRAT